MNKMNYSQTWLPLTTMASINAKNEPQLHIQFERRHGPILIPRTYGIKMIELQIYEKKKKVNDLVSLT